MKKILIGIGIIFMIGFLYSVTSGEIDTKAKIQEGFGIGEKILKNK